MTWRLAGSLATLRGELDAAHPLRSRVSDGCKGNAAHASLGSATDHNPWLFDADGVGVVRACDFTVTDRPGVAIDPAAGGALFDRLRELGAAGDVRLADRGYVIHRRQIASAAHDWAVRPYSGLNAHKGHVHLSVTRDRHHWHDNTRWLDLDPAPPPAAPDESSDPMEKFFVIRFGDAPGTADDQPGRWAWWPAINRKTFISGDAHAGFVALPAFCGELLLAQAEVEGIPALAN